MFSEIQKDDEKFAKFTSNFGRYIKVPPLALSVTFVAITLHVCAVALTSR